MLQEHLLMPELPALCRSALQSVPTKAQHKGFIQILIDEIDLRSSLMPESVALPRLVKPVEWVLPLSWQILLSQLQEMFLPWQKLSKKPLKPDAVLIFPDWDAPSKEAQAHPHL